MGSELGSVNLITTGELINDWVLFYMKAFHHFKALLIHDRKRARQNESTFKPIFKAFLTFLKYQSFFT